MEQTVISGMVNGVDVDAAAHGIRVEEVESKLEGDLDLHGFLGLSEEFEKATRTFISASP